MVCFQGDSVSVKEMFLIGRILYFLTKLTANAIFLREHHRAKTEDQKQSL